MPWRWMIAALKAVPTHHAALDRRRTGALSLVWPLPSPLFDLGRHAVVDRIASSLVQIALVHHPKST